MHSPVPTTLCESLLSSSHTRGQRKFTFAKVYLLYLTCLLRQEEKNLHRHPTGESKYGDKIIVRQVDSVL